MFNYSFEIPIAIEYISPFYLYRNSMEEEVIIDKKIETQEISIHIIFTLNKGFVYINNIESKSEDEALSKVTNLMNKIVNLLSLNFQKYNCNQYNGHLRFVWIKSNVKILSNEEFPRGAVGMTTRTILKLDNFEELIVKLDGTTEIEFISNAYYGSLLSLDYRAKFYHAFTIIEYLENQYKKEIGTKKYQGNHCLLIGEQIEENLVEFGYSKEDATHAKSLVLGYLKNITVENRVQKLLFILSEKFQIKSIKYKIPVELIIDENIVKELINTRNKLFHGKDPENLKTNTDILILICEKIYWYILEYK